MLHSAWAIGSLLLSIGLLLFGHGIHLTALPLLAEARCWSATSNALTTSAYFLGFAVGCLLVPPWLLRIGHIRVFGVLVAMATAVLLTISLVVELPVWLALRFVYGIALSGIYLTVESWLNAETRLEHRGAILSIYAFVTLFAMFGAQVLLQDLQLDGTTFLVVAAIGISLAALPIGLTRREAPRVVTRPQFSVRALLNPGNLPAFASGALAGTFWALAPVYTARIGMDGPGTARFMGAALGGGMLAVYPLGWLSDRIGRITVLAAVGTIGMLATLGFLLFAGGVGAVLLYGVAFGSCMMPLYALCLALANDRVKNGDFIETGSMLIMVHALGMIGGPLLAGLLLTGRDPVVMLWCFAAGFGVLVPLAAMVGRQQGASTAFGLVPRTVPEALIMDPRAELVPEQPPAETPLTAAPAAITPAQN
ncbi:MAG: MFS transporter [Proteobacteria bacterium]|nr:MFS transporter [Pseudomonadota bacterium]